jgi:hypothetical protein
MTGTAGAAGFTGTDGPLGTASFPDSNN